jgi:hypothetical protein
VNATTRPRAWPSAHPVASALAWASVQQWRLTKVHERRFHARHPARWEMDMSSGIAREPLG